MAITKKTGRQYLLVAEVTVNYADLASGVADDCVKLPPGAVVHGGFIATDTAWNSATSDTLSVGDSGSATRYINANATVLRSNGVQQNFAATGVGTKYASGGAIRLTWTGVGAAPTTGSARLYVEYSVDDKALEVQT